jgi:hypothetical protein
MGMNKQSVSRYVRRQHFRRAPKNQKNGSTMNQKLKPTRSAAITSFDDFISGRDIVLQ